MTAFIFLQVTAFLHDSLIASKSACPKGIGASACVTSPYVKQSEVMRIQVIREEGREESITLTLLRCCLASLWRCLHREITIFVKLSRELFCRSATSIWYRVRIREREREREIERENLQGQNETHFECGQRKNRNIRIESEQGLPQCKTWQVKSEACSETSTPRPQHRWSFVTRIHTCVDTPTSHVIRKSITAHRTINL